MSAPARPYAAPRNSTPGAIPTSTSAATATTSPSLPSTAPRHLCPPSRSNSLSVATPSRLKSSSAAHRPSQRQPRWTSASPAPWPKPAHPSPSPTCAPSAASAMQRCTHASPPSPPTAASRARTTATASPAVEHFPLPLPASPTARGKSEREFPRKARSPRHQKACSRSLAAPHRPAHPRGHGRVPALPHEARRLRPRRLHPGRGADAPRGRDRRHARPRPARHRLPSRGGQEEAEARRARRPRARPVTPITCGLVRAPRRLVAVVLGPGGEARRAIRAALSDDARFGLVEYLAAAGAEIVVTDVLVRGDPVARSAVRASLAVWIAPDTLVSAVARAAAITDPARTAAILARLPRVPLLGAQLRRLAASAE